METSNQIHRINKASIEKKRYFDCRTCSQHQESEQLKDKSEMGKVSTSVPIQSKS